MKRKSLIFVAMAIFATLNLFAVEKNIQKDEEKKITRALSPLFNQINPQVPITPPDIQKSYKGRLTLNDNVTILENNSFRRSVLKNSTIIKDGNCKISSQNKIINIRSTDHLDLLRLSGNSNTTIYCSELILNGSLTLQKGSTLIINGSLTINAQEEEYLTIGADATLQVNGNLTINGNDKGHVLNNGTINSTGNLIVKNNSGKYALINNKEIIVSKKALFKNNKSTDEDCILNNKTGTIESTDEMIFKDNTAPTNKKSIVDLYDDGGVYGKNNKVYVDATHATLNSLTTIANPTTAPELTYNSTVTINDSVTIDATGFRIAGTKENIIVNDDTATLTAKATVPTDLEDIASLNIETTTENKVTLNSAALEINGLLKISGSTTFEILGDLTLNGNVPNYLEIEAGSTLTVAGNIILNGGNESGKKRNIINKGSIISTVDEALIQLQGNSNPFGDAILIGSSGVITTTNGTVSFTNNKGKSVTHKSINNLNTASPSITASTIYNCNNIPTPKFGNTDTSTITAIICDEFGEKTTSDATITFTDNIKIDSGVISNVTNLNTVTIVGDAVINTGAASSTLGNINENSGTLTTNTDIGSIAKVVEIVGNVEIIGQLKLIDTDLTITSDLTITGATEDFISIDGNSTLTVDGNLILDGNNSYNIVNEGTIKTSGKGSLTIKNCAKSSANYGIKNTGTIETSETGTLLFQNNSGNSAIYNSGALANIKTIDGDIIFSENSCTDTGAVLNNLASSTVQSENGSIIFDGNTSTAADGYIVNNEATIQTTKSLGSIFIKNNDSIKEILKNTGTINSAKDIKIKDNCSNGTTILNFPQYEIINTGTITAAVNLNLFNCDLNNDQGKITTTSGTVTKDQSVIDNGTVNGSTISQIIGSAIFAGNLSIAGQDLTIPAGSTVASGKKISIKTSGTITDDSSNININKQSGKSCISDKIFIHATELTINGNLTLTGTAQLMISGDLTVNGATDIASGAKLIISGNITFDGNGSSNFKNLGAIETTGGTILIQNHTNSSGIGVENSGTATIKSYGLLSILNNNGSDYGISNATSAIMESTDNNVEFKFNCGGTAAIFNSATNGIVANNGTGILTLIDNTIDDDNSSGTVDVYSTVTSVPGDITITTGSIIVAADQNITMAGTVDQINNDITIETPGTIVAPVNAKIHQKAVSNCVNHAVITGDINLTGPLSLTDDAHLEIVGDLTINGATTISENATLTVSGDITFNGVETDKFVNAGTIVTTAGKINLLNHLNTTGDGIENSGTITATGGILNLTNNKGSTCGVNNQGTLSSDNNVEFKFNCGTTHAVQNGATATIESTKVNPAIFILNNVINNESGGTLNPESTTEITTGSITLTGDILVDTDQILTMSEDTVTRDIYIETSGTTIDVDTNDSNSSIHKTINSQCCDNRVKIYGDVTATGNLTLTGTAHLEIVGDLTVTGSADDYLSIDSTAILTVSGNITFNGSNHSIINNGTIESTAGAITIKEHSNTSGIAVTNASTGIISSYGLLTVTGNKGSTDGINNTGTMTSTNNNIELTFNCGGTGNVINNTGTISAADPVGVVYTLSSPITGGIVTPSTEEKTIGSIELTGNISVDGSQILTMPEDTVTGDIYIETSGAIIDVDTNDSNSSIHKTINSQCCDNRVKIYGDVTATGNLTLDSTANLEIVGNLTINGDVSTSYQTALTVYGDIIFNGSSTNNAFDASGKIEAKGEGSIYIQNYSSATDDAVSILGSIQEIISDSGNIIFCGNVTTLANANGITIGSNASITSNSGNIIFKNNSGNGTGYAINNSGTIEATGADVEFRLNNGGNTATNDIYNTGDGAITAGSGTIYLASNTLDNTSGGTVSTTATFGSITFTDNILVAAGQILTMPNDTLAGHIAIETSGTTIDVTNAANIHKTINSKCCEDRVKIYGDVTANGKLTLEENTHLEIVGNLTINGTMDDYISIDATAKLSVSGDISFNGNNSYSTTNAGTIESTSTGTGTILIKGHNNSSGIGFTNTGSITAKNALSLLNNNGSTDGINNSGSLISTDSNVEFKLNCGDTVGGNYDINNTGTITANSGSGFIYELNNTVHNDGGTLNATSTTEIATGSIEFTDNISVDTNQILTMPEDTVTGDIYIETSGATISVASTANIHKTINSQCCDNRVKIYGDVTATGNLTLTGTAHLEIVGNLTVTGTTNIESGATLTVSGNIIFDGNELNKFINAGKIETTTAGTITIQNHASSNSDAVLLSGASAKVTSDSGDITFSDNSSATGSSNENGVFINNATGEVKSNSGNISFQNNSGNGTGFGVNNTGNINAGAQKTVYGCNNYPDGGGTATVYNQGTITPSITSC